jgi:hypothetical protein
MEIHKDKKEKKTQKNLNKISMDVVQDMSPIKKKKIKFLKWKENWLVYLFLL